jgi:hypothetical protein
MYIINRSVVLGFLMRGQRLCEIPDLEASVIPEVEEIFRLI